MLLGRFVDLADGLVVVFMLNVPLDPSESKEGSFFIIVLFRLGTESIMSKLVI